MNSPAKSRFILHYSSWKYGIAHIMICLTDPIKKPRLDQIRRENGIWGPQMKCTSTKAATVKKDYHIQPRGSRRPEGMAASVLRISNPVSFYA